MDIAIGIVAKGSITAPRLHENIRTDGSPNVVSASVITPQLNAKVRNSTVSVGDEVVLPETLQDSPEAVLSAQADKEWMETAQELRNSRKRNTQQAEIIAGALEQAFCVKSRKLSEKGCATLGAVGEQNCENHVVILANDGTTKAVADGGLILSDNTKERIVHYVMRAYSVDTGDSRVEEVSE